jgi:hypothetical protein
MKTDNIRISILGELVFVKGVKIDGKTTILEADYNPECGKCMNFKYRDLLGAGFCKFKKRKCYSTDKCNQV